MVKLSTRTALLSAAALGLFTTGALAQDQDRLRDTDRDRIQAQDKDRLNTEATDELIDTLYAAQLLQDRDRDRLHDQLRDADSDLDRDRIRDRMQDQLHDQAWELGILLDEEPLHGGYLLNAQEREQYRARLRNAKSAEERERIRTQQREVIQTRAKTQGVKIGDEPIFGGKLMTSRERKNYQKQLSAATSAEARERIRAENQQRMEVRAWERGFNPDHEPVYGGHMMTEQERAQYRQRLENAGTAEARERIRAEHQQRMQQQAQARNQKLGADPIYGGEMMTKRQRNEYREMLQKAGTPALREQLRSAHREMMANHAWEHGIFPGREPTYGGHLLTERERAQYRQQLRSAAGAEAREQVRSQYRDMVQQRARQSGLDAGSPAIFGGEMMTMNERQRFEKRLASANTGAARERVRFEHAAQMQSRMQHSGINPADARQLRSMDQQRFEQQQRGMESMGGMRRGGGRRGG